MEAHIKSGTEGVVDGTAQKGRAARGGRSLGGSNQLRLGGRAAAHMVFVDAARVGVLARPPAVFLQRTHDDR